MNKQEAKKLKQRILKKIPREKFILGLSGGPDSVFLLHILKDQNIVAAHLNHKIRKEADQDQEFVEKLCNTLDIPLETIKIDIKAESKKSKRGLEETGRIERYKFFKKLAQKHQAKTVITGHHADDNLETILMNFTRGGGLKALAGMKIEDKMNNITLLRPLLHTSKSDILAYLKLNKIPYQNDYTNLDTKYTRNNLRKEIIPKLCKINPNLPSTIARNHQNLAEIDDFLEKESQKWIAKNCLDKNFTKFPRGQIIKKHPALQKAILITLYKIHTGHATNLESIHIKETLALIHNNIGNKKKKMGKIEISLKKGNFHLDKSID